jgi:predicted nucleic acid-binding protein
MIVIADTGPLLALAKVKALDLLKNLYQQVITSQTVYTEAVTAGLAMGAADAELLQQAYQGGLLTVRTPAPGALPHSGLLKHPPCH